MHSSTPALVSVLANACVFVVSVSVNRDVLKRLLSQAHDVEPGVGVDRVLRSGSDGNGERYFGLTHQEVALRRDILGLPKRKGRHPVLDERQDAALGNAGKPPARNAALHWTMAPRC